MWPFRNGTLYLPGEQSAERLHERAGVFLGVMAAYLERRSMKMTEPDLEYALDHDGEYVLSRRKR